ncbi:hypothetical protein [Paradevosia shaoguanensis]|uniref:HTH Mu-type domain-containing protein n=1 Tax=Paradevosia shaoguanensis TaxID=1335043 RepID=A0AA41U9W8_9HYPH|nr:hypothetical protein [Paradevosia shaoguanensis]MCF1741260.1 hypothetical protein [Paradevosia shaoguanensis]MCI0125743.1 hypothetical protein [Paradevosia shaoguanensis]
MFNGMEGLDLTINVPAQEWAYNQRRVAYLEAIALRLVRDSGYLQEWFSAVELASYSLPGMPSSAGAITRKASKECWLRFDMPELERPCYHITALPRRAFDEVLSRILALPELTGEDGALPSLPPVPVLVPELPENTAPAWVLPLMRLVRGEAAGNLGKAWHELPKHMPPGSILPTVEEAAQVIANLGLAEKLSSG